MFDQIYVVGACITISLPQKLNIKNPSSISTGGIFWVTIIPYQGFTGGYMLIYHTKDRLQIMTFYFLPSINHNRKLILNHSLYTNERSTLFHQNHLNSSNSQTVL